MFLYIPRLLEHRYVVTVFFFQNSKCRNRKRKCRRSGPMRLQGSMSDWAINRKYLPYSNLSPKSGTQKRRKLKCYNWNKKENLFLSLNMDHALRKTIPSTVYHKYVCLKWRVMIPELSVWFLCKCHTAYIQPKLGKRSCNNHSGSMCVFCILNQHHHCSLCQQEWLSQVQKNHEDQTQSSLKLNYECVSIILSGFLYFSPFLHLRWQYWTGIRQCPLVGPGVLPAIGVLPSYRSLTLL